MQASVPVFLSPIFGDQIGELKSFRIKGILPILSFRNNGRITYDNNPAFKFLIARKGIHQTVTERPLLPTG